MSVITISRDLGSEGDYIADSVAQKLGYHLIEKNFFYKVLSQYGLVEFDREYDELPGFWDQFDAKRAQKRDEEVVMLNRVIRAIAQHGNSVILGRSGYEVLKEFSGIFHVRLQAPRNIRIARIMEERHIPLEQAKTIIEENDKLHKAFIQEYYEIPWDAVRAFDLVINTNKVSPDMAVAWIVDAVKQMGNIAEPNTFPSNLIENDPILKGTVSECLSCELTHW